MQKLFEITKINQMKLNNRFVRSATWEGLANSDGSCSEEIIDMMVDLASCFLTYWLQRKLINKPVIT